jgi:predicted small lipoprotein YifL
LKPRIDGFRAAKLLLNDLISPFIASLLRWPPHWEINSLPSFRVLPLPRLAVIGALALALGLAACGRKGPLDPPPGASLEGVPQAQTSEMSSNGAPPIGGATIDGNPGVGPDGQPQAPKGPQKRIPLDVLLN